MSRAQPGQALAPQATMAPARLAAALDRARLEARDSESSRPSKRSIPTTPHGIHALTSVSERVAYEAPCSVLVLRPARAASRGMRT